MDDPQNENDSVVVDDVVHHPMIADAKTVERIRAAMNRLA